MSTALLCDDKHLDRMVVVKQLEAATDSRRLLDEIAALQVIRSKHVVQIYDVIRDRKGKIVAIVEEFLPGEDLTKAAKPKSSEEFLRLIYPIAEGISDIHAHGRVHRDIKRTNMKFDVEGCLKIFDFGLARDSAGSSTIGEVGTPGYMAPELFVPDPRGLVHFTEAVDTFAFGSTALALLLGKPPKDFRQSPPRVSRTEDRFGSLPFTLDDDLVEILDLCLSSSAKARPSMQNVARSIGLHLLRDRHRAMISINGRTHWLDKTNRVVRLAVRDQGELTINYDGLRFHIQGVSGDVAINNQLAASLAHLPGSCVVVLGSSGLGNYPTNITIDISHPEVAL